MEDASICNVRGVGITGVGCVDGGKYFDIERLDGGFYWGRARPQFIRGDGAYDS